MFISEILMRDSNELYGRHHITRMWWGREFYKVWLHTTLPPVSHKIPKVLCSGGCCFSWPPLPQFPSSFFRAIIFTFAYILATDNKVVTDHVIISKDIAQLKNNYIQLYIGATFSLKTLNSPQLRTPAIKQHFSEEQQIS